MSGAASSSAPMEPTTAATLLPADPALRVPVTNANRSQILRIGRCVPPSSFKFPPTMDGKKERRCQHSYMTANDDLEYSMANDALFCFYCCVTSARPGDWTTKGVNGWKNITAKIHSHQTSVIHKLAVKKFNALLKQQSAPETSIAEQLAFVDAQAKSKREEERRRNRSGMKLIFGVILWLARQCLPFRGHLEHEGASNRGNFHELLQFKLEDDPDRKKWFDNLSDRNKYTSAMTQNQMIHIVADQVRVALLQELNDGDPERVFALCADESTDAAKREQMSVYVRYVNKKGELVERILALVEVPSTKAADLLAAIQRCLNDANLTMNRIVAQCYDGASNMSGEYHGLQQQVRDAGAHSAIYVHCYAHRLNLVIVEVAKSVTIAKKFFATVQGLAVLIGASAKRQNFFTMAQRSEINSLIDDDEADDENRSSDNDKPDDDEPVRVAASRGSKRSRAGEKRINHRKPGQLLRLKQLGETRWSCRVYALVAIKRTYSALKTALEAIAADATDAKHIAAASGLLSHVDTFEFVLMMFLMIQVLEITHDLSQLLQRRGQDLGNAAARVAATISQLESLRSDDSNWAAIYSDAEKFAKDHNVAVPDRTAIMKERTRDIRTWLPGSRFIDDHTTAIDWHRINVFYVITDKVLTELRVRFNNANVNVLSLIRYFLPSMFSQFDPAMIIAFAQLYWQPMDRTGTSMNQQQLLDDLMREVKAFGIYIKSGVFDGLTSMESVLQAMIRDHPDLPVMQKLYRIAITLPVSSASAERSFSAMKRLLTRLRSTMGVERLSDLLLIVIERVSRFIDDHTDVLSLCHPWLHTIAAKATTRHTQNSTERESDFSTIVNTHRRKAYAVRSGHGCWSSIRHTVT